jgi:hypothetical protein
MTAAVLLEDLQARGITLRAEGGRLLARGAVGALTAEDRSAVDALRAELLALLAPWDQARADAALAGCNARLERGLAGARTEAQRRVVEVYRGVVASLAKRRDQLLWDAGEAVEELFRRWADEAWPLSRIPEESCP